MLIDFSNILHVFFELTLFFLLAILLFKGIKLYLIPYIYGEILNIKKKKEDLLAQDDLLSKTSQTVSTKIKEQRKEFVLLEGKINSWRRYLLNKQMEESRSEKTNLDKIKKKRVTQSYNLNILKLEKVVIPSSIKLAYDKIKLMYAGDKGLLLTKELINKIKS